MKLAQWRTWAGTAFATLYLAVTLLLAAKRGGQATAACVLLALAAGAALTASWFSWQPALGLLGLSLAALFALDRLHPPATAGGWMRLSAYLLGSLAAVKLAHLFRRQALFSEERSRLLAESAFEGILLADERGAVLWANARACEIFARRQAELVESSLCELIARQDAACLCAAIKEGGGAVRECSGRRGDGRSITVEISAGKLSGGWFLVIVRDITERKKAEEQIRASLREKEVLLKEIHHRVKNNLQIISSMLQLQARLIQDPQAQEPFRECLERVRAIALLHETLYRSQDMARIDLAAYIRSLVGQLAAAYQCGGAVRFQVEVEDVNLDLDSAMPCGLIVTELVTNALRHAFPEGREGEIRVRLAQVDGRVELTVADNGVGLPEGVDLRSSGTLGLELVSVFAKQLRAQVRVRNGRGAQITVAFEPKLPKGGGLEPCDRARG